MAATVATAACAAKGKIVRLLKKFHSKASCPPLHWAHAASASCYLGATKRSPQGGHSFLAGATQKADVCCKLCENSLITLMA
mmetsp:Transcript_115335/g.229892  ORF Transcript_115335/g.229892 Transcript_115335/m.229892 type:complete len:82 (-) Transcript_115335:1611-1856(-)